MFRDSTVVIGWTVRDSNSIAWKKFYLHHTRPDRPWGPPSLLYNGNRVSFPGVKRPERGIDHPPNVEVKNEKRYTSTFSLCLHGMLRGDLYFFWCSIQ